MKVDLGTCAVCGAKNSKFVEACYKCGAALPWAPNYVAPQSQEAKPKPQNAPAAQPVVQPVVQPVATPQPQPKSSPEPRPLETKGEAKTVVSPPLDLEQFKDDKKGLTDSVAERASRKVPVPTWAIGAGVLGCVALGMALMMAFGNRNPGPVVVTSPALTPLPTLAPDASSTPALTPAPTTAPTAAATEVPTLAPTAMASPAPTPAAVVADGPTFDTLYVNTTTGTPEQQAAYWKTVQNTKVEWRGDFVSLGTSPSGPLTIRCKNGANSAIVTITLGTEPPQTLPLLQPNQSIAVEGILSGYSAQGYELTQGRVR